MNQWIRSMSDCLTDSGKNSTALVKSLTHLQQKEEENVILVWSKDELTR